MTYFKELFFTNKGTMNSQVSTLKMFYIKKIEGTVFTFVRKNIFLDMALS